MTRSTGRIRRRVRAMPIGLRLVLAVIASMSLVLVATSGFVVWRVQRGIDTRLNSDLSAYHHRLVADLNSHQPLDLADQPGGMYQIADLSGHILTASHNLAGRSLLSPSRLGQVRQGHRLIWDTSSLFPVDPNALRVRASTAELSRGPVIVITAIHRAGRDELLRELIGQLAIAAGLVLLAAGYAGYRVTRAALGPVEKYRRRADQLALGVESIRIPIPTNRDDEITRLGHTLNRMLDQVEASADRERQFISDASHELRSPLALMRAEIEVALHRRRSVEELTTTLRAVDSEVTRLIDLANSLLELEELRSGAPIARRPVDLEDFIDTVTMSMRVHARLQDRRMNVVAQPAVVDIEPRWLRQAVTNLIDNALRHGGGEIEVHASIVEAKLHICVTDHGQGFPSAFLPRALHRFTRAESSRSGSGSGLGLSLVAAIANAHDGNVTVGNAPSGGAQVSVNLSITRAPEPAAAPKGLR